MASANESDRGAKSKRSRRNGVRYRRYIARRVVAADVKGGEETTNRHSPAPSSSEEDDVHDPKDPIWVEGAPPAYDVDGDNADGDVAASANDTALRSLYRAGRHIPSVATLQHDIEEKDLTIAKLQSSLDGVNSLQLEKDREIEELKKTCKLLIRSFKADKDELNEVINFNEVRAIRAEQQVRRLRAGVQESQSSLHAQNEAGQWDQENTSAAEADIAALNKFVSYFDTINAELVEENNRLRNSVEQALNVKKRKLGNFLGDDARQPQQIDLPRSAQEAQKIYERLPSEVAPSAEGEGLFVTPEPETTEVGVNSMGLSADEEFQLPQQSPPLHHQDFNLEQMPESSAQPQPERKAEAARKPTPKTDFNKQQRKAEAERRRKSFATLLASIPEEPVHKGTATASKGSRPRLGGKTLGVPASYLAKLSQPSQSSVSATENSAVHTTQNPALGTCDDPVELDDD